MDKRETKSMFEINGRKFIINSFDPMEGNYILTQVLTFALPLGLDKMLLGQISQGSEMATPSLKREKMSKRDFMELQRDVLMTIEEEFPGGNTSPVVRENGTYGISDVTMGLITNLLIASLAFNFKNFFDEFPLTEALNDL